MKLSFKMNVQDYCKIWQVKLNKMNDLKKRIPVLIFLIIIFCLDLICLFFIKNYIIAEFIVLFFALCFVFLFTYRKKAMIKQYEQSAVAKSIYTICTYNDGLEILNSYEKMFVPWQSIYYVKNTEKYILILPTYRKGAVAIDKSRQDSDKINELISILKNHTAVEEGK